MKFALNRRLEPIVFLTFLATALLLLLVSYDASMISGIVFLFVLGFLFRRKRLVGWIPAILVSLIWIVASNDMYAGYNTFKLRLFGIALFPILAWPFFLTFAYTYILPYVRVEPWQLRWLVLSLMWSVGLIVVEWSGYHLLGVHLDRGKAYPGWPILDIFHSPAWMQAAYFGNGIAFMGIASWIDRAGRGARGPGTAELGQRRDGAP